MTKSMKSNVKKLRAYTCSYMSLTDGRVVEFRIYRKYCRGLNKEVTTNGNR